MGDCGPLCNPLVNFIQTQLHWCATRATAPDSVIGQLVVTAGYWHRGCHDNRFVYFVHACSR